MITITFDNQLRYRRAPGFVGPSPLFEVILHADGNSTPRVPGLLDTGSTRTIFKLEFAESLGIDDLATAQSITIQTGGGPLSVYLVDVELEIVLEERSRFGCQVGFTHLPRKFLVATSSFPSTCSRLKSGRKSSTIANPNVSNS